MRKFIILAALFCSVAIAGAELIEEYDEEGRILAYGYDERVEGGSISYLERHAYDDMGNEIFASYHNSSLLGLKKDETVREFTEEGTLSFLSNHYYSKNWEGDYENVTLYQWWKAVDLQPSGLTNNFYKKNYTQNQELTRVYSYRYYYDAGMITQSVVQYLETNLIDGEVWMEDSVCHYDENGILIDCES